MNMDNDLPITGIYPYIKAICNDPGDPAMVLDEGNSPVIRHFNDDAFVAYLYDRGESYRYIQERHLLMSGMSRYELDACAMANFRTLQVTLRPVRGINAVIMNGNLESSLLLVDGFWDLARDDIRGDVVVACPQREVLAFAGSEDPAGLTELRGVIERVWPKGDHRLFPYLMKRCKGGGWQRHAEGVPRR